MAIKLKYQSKDQVPEEHRSLYIERDGAFFLDVEGVPEKAKVEELRSSNRALQKENDELKQRFEGIDPAKVRELEAEKRKLEEAQAVKNGDVEKLLSARLQAAKLESDKQLGALSAERDSLNSRLADLQINQGVVLAATKRGLRPTAIPDATTRARSVFRLDSGTPRAFEADGKTPRYGKDGVTPLTVDEWVDGLVAEAPHLFESNAGGGATGNGSGGAGHGENPWKKETFNLTKQGQIFKQDPARARSLMSAAGVRR